MRPHTAEASFRFTLSDLPLRQNVYTECFGPTKEWTWYLQLCNQDFPQHFLSIYACPELVSPTLRRDASSSSTLSSQTTTSDHSSVRISFSTPPTPHSSNSASTTISAVAALTRQLFPEVISDSTSTATMNAYLSEWKRNIGQIKVGVFTLQNKPIILSEDKNKTLCTSSRDLGWKIQFQDIERAIGNLADPSAAGIMISVQIVAKTNLVEERLQMWLSNHRHPTPQWRSWLNNERLADVVLVYAAHPKDEKRKEEESGQKFFVHRLILETASEYFSSMFRSGLKESHLLLESNDSDRGSFNGCGSRTILKSQNRLSSSSSQKKAKEIPTIPIYGPDSANIPPSVFLSFLEYLYTSELTQYLPMNPLERRQLYQLAHMYQVTSLCHYITDMIIYDFEDISVNNCVEYLQFAEPYRVNVNDGNSTWNTPSGNRMVDRDGNWINNVSFYDYESDFDDFTNYADDKRGSEPTSFLWQAIVDFIVVRRRSITDTEAFKTWLSDTGSKEAVHEVVQELSRGTSFY
ncbi:hypothetical protein G9A89_005078 [Geosiphon pyriformis]|nr:hypothetical protein G9A89_005078 [Geosiphon pyriformis]